jgi:cysteine synthase A
LLDDSKMKTAIRQILAVLPAEWRGTTFNNSKLRGRQGFAQDIEELIMRKWKSGDRIVKEELAEVGNAEDYLRVATNISTLLEAALAVQRGLDVSQVFTFASDTLPIIAVCIISKHPVHLYLGDAPDPFTRKQHDLIKLLGLNLHCYPSYRIRAAKQNEVVLSLESAHIKTCIVDGIIGQGVLYVTNPEKINTDDILVIRKRMSTPMTTPVAEGMLQTMAGMQVTANVWGPASPGITKFLAHLQEMSGTKVDRSANPVVSTVGLSAIASLWMTLIARGGADILMCSTAYGGTVQMTDIFDRTAAKFNKHSFHIQGSAGVLPSIKSELKKLQEAPDGLLPMTVVFLEIPTNPDMKVPDMPELVAACMDHQRATGKKVMLLVDATFAPGSRALQKIREADPELCAMVFISMSKSVSRGLTTAGTVVANHTAEAREILAGVTEACETLDTNAKPDQMARLVENHGEVELRCRKAYENASLVGEHLCQAVRDVTGQDMKLAFVSVEQAEAGFTTSTFSFNLPPREGASAEANEGLAQQFVDLLCAEPGFKPCVSFGQDNGLVYCTVPATSTQGAVKAEDKAKQAVGGVQLTRLSFPPTCDIENIKRVMSTSIAKLYE